MESVGFHSNTEKLSACERPSGMECTLEFSLFILGYHLQLTKLLAEIICWIPMGSYEEILAN